MAGTQLAGVLRHIHQLVGTPGGHEASDTQLLQCFVENRDERAFRLLVERHGRMVLSVCRQVLRQAQDAEDAFQATFLVLAQRAGSIRAGTALASWLYGVAYRTALKARSRMSRRQFHERRAAKGEQTGPDLDLALRELQAVLAEEVRRLPAKFRAPFVLCCLEGLSRSEAARQLGWKEGSVFGRLAEARKLLQRRLARRGVTLAAALCAGGWSTAHAGVSTVLIRTTVQAALGVAPAPVAALAEGVTQTMFLGKAKLAGIMIFALGLIAAGAGMHIHRVFATPVGAEQPAAPAASKEGKPSADKPTAEKGEQVTLSGRVLGPDGRPFAGAKLMLPPDKAKGEAVVRATSDADGRFRFTAQRKEMEKDRILIAAAKDHGPDWADAARFEKGDGTLRLVEDIAVRGRILDLEGRPIKDATVRVLRLQAAPGEDLTAALKAFHGDVGRAFGRFSKHLGETTWAGISTTGKTDATGRFRVTGAGRDRLLVLKVEGPFEHKVLHIVCRPGLDVKALLKPDPDQMSPGIPRGVIPTVYGPTFEHLVRPSKPIVGVVRDKRTGKPIPHAHIGGQAAGAYWEDNVYTDADEQGRYRLIGLPKGPSYGVRAFAGIERNYLPSETRVADSEGLAPVTLNFELVKGVRVRGRVTDQATGKPVRASLWYSPLADNKYFATLPGNDWYKNGTQGFGTDKDGNYSLLALPGSGLIRFRAEIEGENPYLPALLEPAHRNKAFRTGRGGMDDSFLSAGRMIESLWGHHAYRLIDPAPDAESITCNVEFVPGITRAGSVVDPEGKPLTGVTVAAIAAFGGTTTLKDSTFRAVGLTPSRPRLLAFVHKERKLVGHIFLRGDEKEPVTVRMQPWAVVTGRILDESGSPRAGILVNPFYHDDFAARELAERGILGQAVKADRDGKFRLEGVFPGLPFALNLRKGNQFLVPDEEFRKMTLPSGEKDLGGVLAKPYRP